jgi:hypothetical protein
MHLLPNMALFHVQNENILETWPNRLSLDRHKITAHYIESIRYPYSRLCLTFNNSDLLSYYTIMPKELIPCLF